MSTCNSVINDFVTRFAEERPLYEELCAAVKQRLKAILDQKGILALVTARVKDPERLRQKLINRDQERIQRGKPPYQNPADIFEDIPDLVGARVSLYFPGDTAKIEDLLIFHFTMLKTKIFPEKVENYDDLSQEGFTAHKRRIYPGYDSRRFDGYCAEHYRVRFPNPPVALPYPVIIEIQAASVLMHAWSEVEHDLAYKEMMGKVTREEYECLDEINGLVMAGEIALNRLSQLSRKRIQSTQTFDTHYTLASYLTHWMGAANHGDHELGNVETLFDSYKQRNALTHNHLVRQLKMLDQDWYLNPDPLADQLLDQFDNRKNHSIVSKARYQAMKDMGTTELSEEELGKFLKAWNGLDRQIRQALAQLGEPNQYRNNVNQLVEKEYRLSEHFGLQYRELRILRNQIVHGNLAPTPQEYHGIMDRIATLSAYLRERYGV